MGADCTDLQAGATANAYRRKLLKCVHNVEINNMSSSTERSGVVAVSSITAIHPLALDGCMALNTCKHALYIPKPILRVQERQRVVHARRCGLNTGETYRNCGDLGGQYRLDDTLGNNSAKGLQEDAL